MKTIQKEIQKNNLIQKQTIKDIHIYKLNKIIINLDINEFIEDEIEDEINIDDELNEESLTYDEVEDAPYYEDFDDDETYEEDTDDDIDKISPIKRSKFVVEFIKINSSNKYIPYIPENININLFNKADQRYYKTSLFIRLEIAKFLIERQEGYLFQNSPLKKLTQKEILTHINGLLNNLPNDSYITIKLSESQISYILRTLFIKINNELYPATKLISGKRSELSSDEWNYYVKKFMEYKNINQITKPTLELAKEFESFLQDQGVNITLTGKSSNEHDKYKTLKNKLKQFMV